MAFKNRDHYQRALEVIPWATQTNAKRLLPGCCESMPPFIKRADGCRMWDLDDCEYIDFRASLGPIILGYRHPAVEQAVRDQMENGVLFSMASPLELEATEAVMQNVPWLEQVRFMKTGADACTCCVRLARAFTGRDRIVSIGYHGYHDWFAFQWPNNGVPAELKKFVYDIPYGDSREAEHIFVKHGDKIAAVITEPYDWQEIPGEEFIKTLRALCDRHGSLLIFDEILTGFRLARGGAQEYYGVTPDLSAFAKAMANGYPLSAYAGKKRYMQQLEKTILTTTYAGETLSLAACIAVMKVMQNEPVHDHIVAMGQRLKDGMDEIISEIGIPAHTGGVAQMPLFRFDFDDASKNMLWHDQLFSKLYSRGVFANDRWIIMYAHQAADIDYTLEQIRLSIRELC
ncbi:aminotransferase class III-fold pyridoxal phosphate-dependent enzyme [candidate division KSB1 bacterium]|nr:aminotransferase class III-fold pyridoxal phosphate-dependent enzyme [candidate division KSB1 bacterium]